MWFFIIVAILDVLIPDPLPFIDEIALIYIAYRSAA